MLLPSSCRLGVSPTTGSMPARPGRPVPFPPVQETGLELDPAPPTAGLLEGQQGGEGGVLYH